jgi:hypothetical protein
LGNPIALGESILILVPLKDEGYDDLKVNEELE